MLLFIVASLCGLTTDGRFRLACDKSLTGTSKNLWGWWVVIRATTMSSSPISARIKAGRGNLPPAIGSNRVTTSPSKYLCAPLDCVIQGVLFSIPCEELLRRQMIPEFILIQVWLERFGCGSKRQARAHWTLFQIHPPDFFGIYPTLSTTLPLSRPRNPASGCQQNRKF